MRRKKQSMEKNSYFKELEKETRKETFLLWTLLVVGGIFLLSGVCFAIYGMVHWLIGIPNWAHTGGTVLAFVGAILLLILRYKTYSDD